MTVGVSAMTENFGELFWRAVRLYPDKVAVEQDGVRLSYTELEERTQRAARLLRSLGVSNETKVLLMFPNDFRLIECLFATLRAGGAAVLANVRLGTETLQFIAADCDARVLIAHASLTDKAMAVRAAAPGLQHVLIADDEGSGAQVYDDRLADTPAGFETAPVGRNDVALIMYTSGSTGRPKGCLLSHGNKWWQAQSSARTLMLDESDKALVMGPLYHANALWMCLLPMLLVGGSVAILPGFEPDAVLAAIERYRPTFTSGTPNMFSQLLARYDTSEHDVSSLRLLSCGSAPVSAELMASLIRQFRCDVVEGYGLTEGGANVITPRWGVKKLGSAGLPVPGVEIRIVDPADLGRDCAPGQVGELWTRSPANALGYYKQSKATAEKFTRDGWLRTGDLVRADDQGYLTIISRVDDMINCGGENIYPKEVEDILMTYPAVAEVCVIPAHHRMKGQAPVAWVVLRQPGSATEEDLKRHFLARGPAYAHPRRVFFIDRLPVSGTNKVDRKRLEDETQRLLPGGLGGSQA